MNAHEYSLLFAVSMPIAILVCMNFCLWLGGERASLLVPVLTSA